MFVRLVSDKGEEIFFVATPTDSRSYVFELDVAKTAKDSFNHQSGTYSMVRYCMCTVGMELHVKNSPFL